MQTLTDRETLPPDTYKAYFCCQHWSPGTPPLGTSAQDPPSVELPMVGQAAFCSSPAAQPPCLINNCTQIGESSSWPVTLRSRAHKHIYLRGHFPSFVFSRCTAPSSVLLLLFPLRDTLLRRDFLLSSLAICLVCRLSLLRLMVSSIRNLLVCLSTMSGSSLRRAIRLLA
jgi:hypothetical protein